jgi:hypothetical protein
MEKAMQTNFSPLVPGIIEQAPRSPLKTTMLAVVQGCLNEQDQNSMLNSDDYSIMSSWILPCV